MDLPDQIQKFLDNKIPLKDFGDILIHSAIGIISKRFTNEEKKELYTKLSDLVPQLPDNVYDEYPRPFLHFAINIADRLIYAQLKAYDLNFQAAQGKIVDANNLCIYLCYRVLNSKNKVLLVHYLDEKMNETKLLEAKFVLLEMYLNTIKIIDGKCDMFKTVLPNMQKPLKDGIGNIVQFYLEKRLKDKQVSDPDGYFATFSKWILDYMIRVLQVIKNTKEVKNVKQVTKVNELFEQTDIGQITQKMSDKNKILKHYCTLFFLDIYDHIFNLHKLSEGEIDYINSAFTKAKSIILEFVGQNQQELLMNGLNQLKFLQVNEEPTKEEWQTNIEYNNYTPYNIQSLSLFLQEYAEKPEFKHIYSAQHQLQYIIPITVAFYRTRTQQVSTKLALLELCIEAFKRLPKNFVIKSQNQFEMDIIVFIDHILVNFGNKDKTEQFIEDLILKFTPEIQTKMIMHCSKFTAGQLFLENQFTKTQITKEIVQQKYFENNTKLQSGILFSFKEINSIITQQIADIDQDYLIENSRAIQGVLKWIEIITKFKTENTQFIEENQEKTPSDFIFQEKNNLEITEKLQKLKEQFNKFLSPALKEVQETIKEIHRDPQMEDKEGETKYYESKEKDFSAIEKLLENLVKK